MLNFQSYQASGLSKMLDLDAIPVHAGIYGGIKIAIYPQKNQSTENITVWL